MRSKTGHESSINSIVIKESLKIVISARNHSIDFVVSIHEHIGNATREPRVVNVIVVTSPVQDGDYGI